MKQFLLVCIFGSRILAGDVLSLDELHFSNVFGVCQNGPKVALYLLRQGSSLAIFNFETQTVEVLTDQRIQKFLGLPFANPEGKGFVWINPIEIPPTAAITDDQNEFVETYRFQNIPLWKDKWKVVRVNQLAPDSLLWLTIHDVQEDKLVVATLAWKSKELQLHHTVNWDQDFKAFFYSLDQPFLVYHSETGQMDLYDWKSLSLQKNIKPGREPIPREKVRPNRRQHKLRLQTPVFVNGKTYIQSYQYLENNGDPLLEPKLDVLVWDGVSLGKVRNFPLAYHQGQFLAMDREERTLGLVGDLNEVIIEVKDP